MPKFTSPLEGVRVAAPCKADWGKMVGDERVRYCNQCSLHVYNLSGMTKREAEGLVANSEGRLCVRFYRRADGSILTSNCPTGLRAIRQRVSRIAGAALSAALGFFAGIGLDLGARPAPPPTFQTMGAMTLPAGSGYVAPPPVMEEPIMGDIAAPGQVVGAIEIRERPVVGRLRPKRK